MGTHSSVSSVLPEDRVQGRSGFVDHTQYQQRRHVDANAGPRVATLQATQRGLRNPHPFAQVRCLDALAQTLGMNTPAPDIQAFSNQTRQILIIKQLFRHPQPLIDKAL
ncbi:MAG TPA: hypothetical protein DDZ22_08955 [Massilia sp.]|nr:hypothetical protein [Massilia sp.]